MIHVRRSVATARRRTSRSRTSSSCSIPDGYTINPRLPYILNQEIPLGHSCGSRLEALRLQSGAGSRAVRGCRMPIRGRLRPAADRSPPHKCAGRHLEFALLYAGVMLPLTFMVIFVAEMLWVWHSVIDFTRDGARYAATHCWQSRCEQRPDLHDDARAAE